MAAKKPIVYVDFDEAVRAPDGEPRPGALEGLLDHLAAGYRVTLCSARDGGTFLGQIRMRRWLARQLAEHWVRGGSSPVYDADVECLSDARRLHWRFSTAPAQP
jgi:hypothetical protein